MKVNPSRRPYWTQWQDYVLAEMWHAGASGNEIAARLGTTKNAVIGRRARLNLPARGNPIARVLPVSRMDECAELMAEGFTFSDAAREMGVSYDTVRGIFSRIRSELGAQAV